MERPHLAFNKPRETYRHTYLRIIFRHPTFDLLRLQKIVPALALILDQEQMLVVLTPQAFGSTTHRQQLGLRH